MQMPEPEPVQEPLPQDPPPPMEYGVDNADGAGADDNRENNGVNVEAQKAAGTLSYILNDASEETLNSTIKQVIAAAVKNPNMTQKLKDNIEDKINGDGNNDEDGEGNEEEEADPTMAENRKRAVSGLIDEALDEIFGVDGNERKKGKKKTMTRPETKLFNDTDFRDNPFTSPY